MSSGLPQEAIPVSKLEFGARLPGSELTGTQRKPERMLEARSCRERLADIRVNSDDVCFGSRLCENALGLVVGSRNHASRPRFDRLRGLA